MTLGDMVANPLFWSVVVAIDIVAIALALLLKRAGTKFLKTRTTHKSKQRKEELDGLVYAYVQKPLLRQAIAFDLSFSRWISMLLLIFGTFVGIVLVVLIPSLEVRGIHVPEWVGTSITTVAVVDFILFGFSVSHTLDVTEVLSRAYVELTKEQLTPTPDSTTRH